MHRRNSIQKAILGIGGTPCTRDASITMLFHRRLKGRYFGSFDGVVVEVLGEQGDAC